MCRTVTVVCVPLACVLGAGGVWPSRCDAMPPPGVYFPGTALSFSQAVGVTSDGVWVVGNSYHNVDDRAIPFRWSLETGRQDSPADSAVRIATAISDDGLTIVGNVSSSPATSMYPHIFRQRIGGAYEDLTPTYRPPPATSPRGALAVGVTPDGTAVVGSIAASSPPVYFGTIWRDGQPTQPIGVLGSHDASSRVEALSRDGSTIVGEAANYVIPFVWRAETGMVALPGIGGDYFSGRAVGVSKFGTTIVGALYRTGGDVDAVLWSDGVAQVLGRPPGSNAASALGVSDDGATVFGTARFSGVSHDFIWTASGGFVDMGIYFSSFGVSLPTDLVRISVTAMSGDATCFVGTSSAGAFVVYVPTPGMLVVVVAAVSRMARRRR